MKSSIATSISAHPEGMIQTCREFQRLFLFSSSDTVPPGLLNGKAGFLIYLLHAFECEGDDLWYDHAFKFLESVIEDVLNDPGEIGISYAEGITGIAYGLQSISKEGLIEIDEDILRKFDSIIYEWTVKESLRSNLDFLYGAAGGMHYLLLRLDTCPEMLGYIEHVLDCWDEVIQTEPRGKFFYANKGGIRRNSVQTGLAHGLSSLLILYRRLFDRAIRAGDCSDKIRGISNYLISFRRLGDQVPHFPISVVFEGDKIRPDYLPKLAWCNGDLAIGYALLKANAGFSGFTFQSDILKVCMDATARKVFIDTQLTNIQVCHGTTGVSLLFESLNRLFPHGSFNDAAEFWHKQTVDRFDNRHPYLKVIFEANCSLLNGLTGVDMSVGGETIASMILRKMLLLD